MIQRNKMIYASKKDIDSLLESIQEDETDIELMETGKEDSTIPYEEDNQFTYLHYIILSQNK
jgi:hypothetical protein